MIKAALFDFDMTLIDSSYGVSCCLNLVAEMFGLPPVERSIVLKTIGYPMEQAMEMLWGSFDPLWIEYYRNHLVPFENERLAAFPGVEETLCKLKKEDISMAVVSNRRRLRSVVSSAGLCGFFSSMIGMDDVQKPKPDPEPLLLALVILNGESPERAVFIGDSEVDARAAKSAGIRFIGLTTGGRNAADLLSEGAIAVLDSFTEIFPLICPHAAGVTLTGPRGVL